MTKELAAQGKMIVVEGSSLIKHYVYYASLKALSVGLKDGSVYRYRNVDQATFDAFEDAPSKGSYFARFIRGHFEMEPIEVMTQPAHQDLNRKMAAWPFPKSPRPEEQPAEHYEAFVEWSPEEEDEFFKILSKDQPQV